MGKLIDISGQRFGFWLAKSLGPKNKNGQTQWLCRCECGKEKLVTLNSLRTGNSTSCGCNHTPNLEKEKFGKLTVLALDNIKCDGRRRWVCQCECDRIITATTYQLRNHKITSCDSCRSKCSRIDFLAENKFKSKLNISILDHFHGTN